MKTDKDKLLDFIFNTVKTGWLNWEPEQEGYEKTAWRYVSLVKEYARKNLKETHIDYLELRQYFVRFFDNCSAKSAEDLKWLLIPTLVGSGTIKFKDYPVKESNKKIRSSYKRIKSVLYSFAHSFFSLMNSPIEDLVFEAMDKQNIKVLKILFSKNKIYPPGEYSQELWGSMAAYMDWLPSLANSQNIDSRKIKNIIVTVTKQPDRKKIIISAVDDRGIKHTAEV